MMCKGFRVACCAVLSLAVLSGCAQPSSRLYTQNQTQRAQTVDPGTVVSVQQVNMQGDQSQWLTVGGAALGGIAGSKLGNGSRGSAAGAIAGALAGGYGTQALQQSMGSQTALEITVKLDSGRMISIVQAADVSFVKGERVRVLSGAGADRVVPF